MIKRLPLGFAPLMIARLPRRRAWTAGALAVALLAGSHPARAGERPGESGNAAKAIEVLADLTLIDGACHNLEVNFGTGFRFAAEQGLTVAAIMPTGAQRSAFERVLQMRQASFDRQELCGEVAGNYAEALPGSVTGLSSRGSGKP